MPPTLRELLRSLGSLRPPQLLARGCRYVWQVFRVLCCPGRKSGVQSSLVADGEPPVYQKGSTKAHTDLEAGFAPSWIATGGREETSLDFIVKVCRISCLAHSFLRRCTEHKISNVWSQCFCFGRKGFGIQHTLWPSSWG